MLTHVFQHIHPTLVAGDPCQPGCGGDDTGAGQGASRAGQIRSRCGQEGRRCESGRGPLTAARSEAAEAGQESSQARKGRQEGNTGERVWCMYIVCGCMFAGHMLYIVRRTLIVYFLLSNRLRRPLSIGGRSRRRLGKKRRRRRSGSRRDSRGDCHPPSAWSRRLVRGMACMQRSLCT